MARDPGPVETASVRSIGTAWLAAFAFLLALAIASLLAVAVALWRYDQTLHQTQPAAPVSMRGLELENGELRSELGDLKKELERKQIQLADLSARLDETKSLLADRPPKDADVKAAVCPPLAAAPATTQSVQRESRRPLVTKWYIRRRPDLYKGPL